METNRIPPQHLDDNPTGCCPRFHPEDWQDVTLRLRDKPFLRAETRSALHIPLNMGSVFTRVLTRLADTGADAGDQHIVLSRELSAWKAEHLFAIGPEGEEKLAGQETVRLSGDFLTRVFEGPYRNLPDWQRTLQQDAAARGRPEAETWFWYATCPKCAKAHGRNYVVGLARL